MMVNWCLLMLIAVSAASNDGWEKPRHQGNPPQPKQASNCNDVPEHPFDLILGRPTANSVTASVLCYKESEGFIEYGPQQTKLSEKTPTRTFRKNEPVEVTLSSLQPNTRYYYRLHLADVVSEEYTFHTARPTGSGFTFTVTADSHLDEHTDAALYQRTLLNALADEPDFHLDLGDTFMTEKHESRAAAAKQYLAQRYYFGQLCASAPLFLTLGNHDGETPRGRDEKDSLAVWSNAMRKRYFPNPVPDSFYPGNGNEHSEAGLLQDYYAWRWGDALFVVLDPFWFTQNKRGEERNWGRTLGNDQYRWLQTTLKDSKAKFKFVFIHHLAGGADDQGRGGAEAVPFYEWGGKNPDGREGFKRNRPGWSEPIHSLLVENRVSIVFHGHDHLYAKQDVDGVVYQEVPQPGDSRGNTRSAAEYGYKSGVILGSSGHLRVAVSGEKATVDYIAATLSQDKRVGRSNRQILHSYTISPVRKVELPGGKR